MKERDVAWWERSILISVFLVTFGSTRFSKRENASRLEYVINCFEFEEKENLVKLVDQDL